MIVGVYEWHKHTFFFEQTFYINLLRAQNGRRLCLSLIQYLYFLLREKVVKKAIAAIMFFDYLLFFKSASNTKSKAIEPGSFGDQKASFG